MVTSSAPGKVYLFGEHAVVYGEPAVPCAIERRVHVTATEIDEGLRIHANDLQLDGFTVEYTGDGESHPDVDVAESLVEAGMGYVNEAVAQARDAADAPEAGFEISVEGDIPLGAGLGSSAALVVAAIDAATRELGVELPASEIADRAYQVEHEVQDGQASRADTFCSAMGGAVRVEGNDCRRLDGIDTLPFVIGYDGGAGDTGALVAGVRTLRDEYDFAADTVAAIGDIVREGEAVLETGDYERLGELMDFNHGLLSALGVSSRSLDSMVWAARDADAHGAKLTGAGGGGCIVALDETDDALTALKYTPGCEDVFRAELDTDGVRQE
ncbi:mevalonate kinase [Haloarcula hispanica N601]|uniref:Mevalonate kinase n=3 Tax=Haloarcula hispanica TaxID=51589 RepID=V5TJV4_HALHI|nr:MULTISPECIES: mevalonate kinase [Haloarcula]AEM56454.1 mevalonate kinase [Haloarcula hispanica ATCC 33960]AHB65267.1 mevalonate kinase [Haloarcula hispanica N601]MCJ0618244.1 mevalonate kinase [Haloarcula hispanica]MUV49824.1 mevalonate kinase [Haloarcula sp. CBA1122]RYJ08854.1 mevalonate kinase [Haloarcula hispanica]